MRSNVTMLYGHIETAEERVDHMLRARALQDETGGFQAFIPLAFHPDNNQMRKLPAPTATDTLRVHAVARLMLDNIPHVKAFWIATGVEVAQTALWFGVDDLDGTVQEEKIYHMAGARTPEAMTTREIERLIRAAGREPVERDTLYNVVSPTPRALAGRRLVWRFALSARRPSSAERWRSPCSQARQTVVRLEVQRSRRLPGMPRCGVWLFHVPACEKFHKSPRNVQQCMLIPLLTEYEKEHISERQPLPERYLGLSDEEMDAPHRRRQGRARPPARHPRPSLSARRGHQVRRLHRRLLQARAAGQPGIPTPSSSSSAACTSWPRAPTC